MDMHKEVTNEKKIWVGCDHAGYSMKTVLIEYLRSLKYEFIDCGCFDNNSVDYPDYAKKVAVEVMANRDSIGFLLCGSGIGVSITANRWKGIRAALCWNAEIVKLSRQHNDANILCLPARFISEEEMKDMVSTFLNTEFERGRHINRIKKIENE